MLHESIQASILKPVRSFHL